MARLVVLRVVLVVILMVEQRQGKRKVTSGNINAPLAGAASEPPKRYI